jgi:hypothetical protein
MYLQPTEENRADVIFWDFTKLETSANNNELEAGTIRTLLPKQRTECLEYQITLFLFTSFVGSIFRYYTYSPSCGFSNAIRATRKL